MENTPRPLVGETFFGQGTEHEKRMWEGLIEITDGTLASLSNAKHILVSSTNDQPKDPRLPHKHVKTDWIMRCIAAEYKVDIGPYLINGSNLSNISNDQYDRQLPRYKQIDGIPNTSSTTPILSHPPRSIASSLPYGPAQGPICNPIRPPSRHLAPSSIRLTPYSTSSTSRSSRTALTPPSSKESFSNRRGDHWSPSSEDDKLLSRRSRSRERSDHLPLQRDIPKFFRRHSFWVNGPRVYHERLEGLIRSHGGTIGRKKYSRQCLFSPRSIESDHVGTGYMPSDSHGLMPAIFKETTMKSISRKYCRDLRYPSLDRIGTSVLRSQQRSATLSHMISPPPPPYRSPTHSPVRLEQYIPTYERPSKRLRVNSQPIMTILQKAGRNDVKVVKVTSEPSEGGSNLLGDDVIDTMRSIISSQGSRILHLDPLVESQPAPNSQQKVESNELSDNLNINNTGQYDDTDFEIADEDLAILHSDWEGEGGDEFRYQSQRKSITNNPRNWADNSPLSSLPSDYTSCSEVETSDDEPLAVEYTARLNQKRKLVSWNSSQSQSSTEECIIVDLD